MVAIAHEDLFRNLFLSVTLQAEVCIACFEHLRIDRSMRRMAGGTAFPERFMLERKGSFLSGMALETGFILLKMTQTCRRGISFMGVMAIRAGDLAFENRMPILQAEFRFLVDVTIETGLRRFARIDDLFDGTAGFDVQTATTVAGFTSDSDSIFTAAFYPGMRGRVERIRLVLMAGRTGFRSHE